MNSRLGVLIAAVVGLGYQFVFRSFTWVQKLWGTELRSAGNLRDWWLLSALVVSVQLTIIIGLSYLFLDKWLKTESKLLLVSTCTDLSLSILLWFLGAVSTDSLGGSRVATGLGQYADILGTLWVVVTFSRFAVISKQVQTRMIR